MKARKLFILPVIVGTTILTSCKNKEPIVSLAYGTLENVMTEIDYTTLSTMIKDNQSFILAITSSSLGCGCWSTFKNQVIAPYMEKQHVLVYYINHNEFYDASHKLLDTYGLKITADPGFGIYNKGSLAYSEIYSSKNYVFSKPEYFEEYMENKVTMPHIYYVSISQLDEMYKDTNAFTILFARSNCGDCQYLLNNYLYDYGISNSGSDKPLYVIDTEKIIINKNNSTYPLRDYDEEGNLTPISQERWQQFKNEYGLSNVNNVEFGYNNGYVPTFINVEPDGTNKVGSVIKAEAVYFNDVVEEVDDKYIITDSYYTEERKDKLTYLKNTETKVLKGLELNEVEVTRYGEYVSWNHDAAEKYHNEILDAFIKEYLS